MVQEKLHLHLQVNMAEIKINGKTVVTQTGNAEPEIGGNVLMHSNAINTALSGATFPAGHVIQVVTDSKSHSGNGIAVSGSGATITESSGYQLFNTAFTPKYSTSKIIIQTSNVLVEETSNVGDWGWLGAWYDTTNVAFVYSTPYAYHFSGNLNFTIHSLNHSFNSWGTTVKNINVRGGFNAAGFILHQYDAIASYYPTSPSTQTVGLTIMEVMQ